MHGRARVNRFDFDQSLDPEWWSERELGGDVGPDADRDADRDPDPVGRRRGGALRVARSVGLAVVAGLCIWAVVTALSPSTLIDTTNAPEREATSASGDTPDVEGGGGSSGDDGGVLEASGTVPADGSGPVDPVGPVGSTADGDGAEDGGPLGSLDYQSNLDLILSASVRNRNHDDSPYLSTPSAALRLEDHFGPRTEYLGNPAGNPEHAFPIPAGGQFRAGCEFSHFSYDDPLVHPGKPGASHLHLHFGNTHLNAFTTYESLINSGSSTCNGQELNRTGYWVPALFDGQGNVRIPERIVVYYKGEGRARGGSEVYPEGAAMIADYNLNTMPAAEGGVGGKKLTFLCTDNFSTQTGTGAQTMPDCDGSRYGSDGGRWVVLEMNVKFPQCWNGRDPSDWTNFQPPSGDWYVSRCEGEFTHTLPNLEYFVNYRVDPGENTRGWFLSSDVDPTSFGATKATGGSTSHGDWWSGWHKEVNQMWVDNCVNFVTDRASGCGRGYLTDGGPDSYNPIPGPALKIRPQYEGPHKVPAETILRELCPDPSKVYSKPEDAAYCAPGVGL